MTQSGKMWKLGFVGAVSKESTGGKAATVA